MRRAFVGLSRMNFNVALLIIYPLLPDLFLDRALVASKCTCRRELAEFVSDMILRDIYGNELTSVMDVNGQTDHLREDGASA